MRAAAAIDEATLLRAWKRYCGSLYTSATTALAEIDRLDLHLVILSGGYGVVRYDEPIGNYDHVFKASSWPAGLLEDVLLEYVRRYRLRSVRAFASSTTSYLRFLTRVRWNEAGLDDVVLLAPGPSNAAQKQAPRAEGEAFAELIWGRLASDWVSSDGIALEAIALRSPGGAGYSPT
jgi:hypothetical protein